MTTEEPTDAELMLAYADGDQTAFARLYQRHRGPLFRYFRRQLPGDQADDCFQVLWLKVIDHAPRYRATGPFDHYLFTLAHNVLNDHYRKHYRTRPERGGPWNDGGERSSDAAPDATAGGPDWEALEIEDGAPGPDGKVAEDELRQRLLALLQRLPFHQREAWVLKQEAAMSTEAIAAITHTSIEGVRSRLRYATRKLKAGLARHV